MKTKLFAPLLCIACALILSGCPGIDPNYIPVTGVSVEPESVTLQPGGTVELKINVTPLNATDQRGTLYIDDITRATATLLDPFTFLITVPDTAEAGTVTLTAIQWDGGFTATCTITVEPAVAEAVQARTMTRTATEITPENAEYHFGILRL